jgi:hypothetical protein
MYSSLRILPTANLKGECCGEGRACAILKWKGFRLFVLARGPSSGVCLQAFCKDVLERTDLPGLLEYSLTVYMDKSHTSCIEEFSARLTSVWNHFDASYPFASHNLITFGKSACVGLCVCVCVCVWPVCMCLRVCM